MKSYKPVICAALILTACALAVATFTPSHTEAAASPAFAPVTAVPLYRFYQPASDFHFYTADPAERMKIKNQPGWVEEGTVGYVFPQYVPGTVPLYRVVKSELGGTNHFYSIDPFEVDAARQKGGWALEGVACYVARDPANGTMPLYRLYKPYQEAVEGESHWYDFLGGGEPFGSPASGDAHFYTSNTTEMTKVAGAGYQLVRVEAYVWSQPTTLGASAPPPAPAPPPESYYTDQLFNQGCGKSSGGGINCPTKNGYFTCEYLRKAGKIKAAPCAANFDLAAFNKIEANLIDQSCKRFVGRPGEYVCESWAGGDTCDNYVKTSNGLVTKCYTPRTNLINSYKNSFGREPTAKEIDYWSGEMKAKKLAYKDVMKAHSQWLKTDAASTERKGVANRSVYEAYGRYPSADEVNNIADIIARGGTSYADLVKGHVSWMTGGSPQQNQELRAMIGRAFASAKQPQPGEAQYNDWMAKVKAQKLTFVKVVAMLKK
jgi:hypothetical protein